MKIQNVLMALALLSSCARAPLKGPEGAMRKMSSPPKLVDSLSKESFFHGLKKHIEGIKSSTLVRDPMLFGPKKMAKANYVAAIEKIFQHENDWLQYIAGHFDFYEVYGKDSWGDIMATGYYEPRIKGSRSASPQFPQPIYARPNDLVTIDYKAFGLKAISQQGRIFNNVIGPYFSRKDIDEDLKLQGRNLEIAYLDSVDAFFLQTQGSGYIEFENGEVLHVGFDSQNGLNYVPIGKFLTDSIPFEQMSLQKIKEHLKKLPRKEKQDLLNKNPSYVFFKKIESAGITYAGMEVSAGRTIATDKELFPKGALAFLEIDEPQFSSLTAQDVSSWVRKSRLVFDQDTGGAIKGGGRIDLYIGIGDEAAQKAGVMRDPGRLYYLVPR
ncbi:MAG: MltA domain-containing protein [Bacteriovorax sp.]|nr:MltA domain-containing protein [Bacteriovorax sp.]